MSDDIRMIFAIDFHTGGTAGDHMAGFHGHPCMEWTRVAVLLDLAWMELHEHADGRHAIVTCHAPTGDQVRVELPTWTVGQLDMFVMTLFEQLWIQAKKREFTYIERDTDEPPPNREDLN